MLMSCGFMPLQLTPALWQLWQLVWQLWQLVACMPLQLTQLGRASEYISKSWQGLHLFLAINPPYNRQILVQLSDIFFSGLSERGCELSPPHHRVPSSGFGNELCLQQVQMASCLNIMILNLDQVFAYVLFIMEKSVYLYVLWGKFFFAKIIFFVKAGKNWLNLNHELKLYLFFSV